MKNKNRLLLALLVSGTLMSGAQATTIVQSTATDANFWPGIHSASAAGAQWQYFADGLPTTPWPEFIASLNDTKDSDGVLSMGHTEQARAAEPHNIASTTELANKSAAAERVSEPATEILMMMALGALAIAVRRQAPD